MIKRKMGQTAILNRLSKLEMTQNNKDHISVIVFGVEDDGRIVTFNIGKGGKYFETMFEAENCLLSVPGVTKDTVILIDDVAIGCDLYLSAEPILYFGDSAERREFLENNLSPKKWLPLYINLIQRALTLAIEKPDMQLPGFDDPALKDLIANCNSISIEQLIERYKDQKWFKENKK